MKKTKTFQFLMGSWGFPTAKTTKTSLKWVTKKGFWNLPYLDFIGGAFFWRKNPIFTTTSQRTTFRIWSIMKTAVFIRTGLERLVLSIFRRRKFPFPRLFWIPELHLSLSQLPPSRNCMKSSFLPIASK